MRLLLQCALLISSCSAAEYPVTRQFKLTKIESYGSRANCGWQSEHILEFDVYKDVAHNVTWDRWCHVIPETIVCWAHGASGWLGPYKKKFAIYSNQYFASIHLEFDRENTFCGVYHDLIVVK